MQMSRRHLGGLKMLGREGEISFAALLLLSNITATHSSCVSLSNHQLLFCEVIDEKGQRDGMTSKDN